MSRSKGVQAGEWLALYLRQWWPFAEKRANGLAGADILNTPGVAFELKTGAEWRNNWVTQAAKYGKDGNLPIVVYLPPGIANGTIGRGMMIMPLQQGMQLLELAGYTPHRADGSPMNPTGFMRALRAQLAETTGTGLDPDPACEICGARFSEHTAPQESIKDKCLGFESPPDHPYEIITTTDTKE